MLVALLVFAPLSQAVAVGIPRIVLYAPSLRYLTWRSVVLSAEGDFDHPRVTRYACQAHGRTVPFGGLWGTQAARSREMVLGPFPPTYLTSRNTCVAGLVYVI